MRELLALRHGMTEANERRVFTGAMDIPLSDRGRESLKAKSGTYSPAERYFTSGMLRAKQTLFLLYGDVPHADIPFLSEYRFGDFEGRSHQELFETEPIYREWLEPGNVHVVCPGGESRAMFDARIAKGWRALLAYEWKERAVLISHGGVLNTIMRTFASDGKASGTPDNGCGWLLWLDGDQIIKYEAFS